MKKKFLSVLIAAVLSIMLIVAMAACGQQEQENNDGETTSNAGTELTSDEYDALMWQISDQEELQYQKYIPDEGFAEAEVFGVDRDGDNGTAYATLSTGEYVTLKGKAYFMSGGQGEVIIKFKYTDEQPELSEVIWSADGDDHEAWLEENFPAEYLKKARAYNGYDETGKSILQNEIEKEVETEMKVPVETENLLEIDLEKGTYEIIKTIESGEGEDYTFDTETIEKGKLSDLEDQ